jgi:hypothetical protein
MAHEIVDGMDICLTRSNDAPAWHALDKRFDCIDAATLRAEGFARPVQIAHAGAVDAQGNGIVSDEHKAIVTTNLARDAIKVVSIVGTRYACDANGYESLIKVVEPLLDRGLLSIVTAGTLRGYQRAYLTTEIIGADLRARIMPGDDIQTFLNFADGLDAMTKAKKWRSRTRIVCANTLAAALSDAKGMETVKHTRGFQMRLADWTTYIVEEQAALDAEATVLRQLASKQVDAAALDAYLRECFDVPETTKTPRGAYVQALETHDQDMARGTLWGAYNAAQSTLQWFSKQGKTDSARVDNMFFGQGVAQNQSFLNAALARL